MSGTTFAEIRKHNAPKEVEHQQKAIYDYNSYFKRKYKNNRKKTKGRNVFYTQTILYYEYEYNGKMRVNTLKSKTITHRPV